MSRDDGFRVADIDVGILDDPKVRSLIRGCADEALAARCLVALVATFVSSWARGERVRLEDAAPLWISDLPTLAGQLTVARLLDDEHRIPMHAWTNWFGPAADRREKRRAAGSKGGKASHEPQSK